MIEKITFKISATPLAENKYQPKIELVEGELSSKEFQGFVIHEEYSSKDEALTQAKLHALDEGAKRYGSGVEIDIEVED